MILYPNAKINIGLNIISKRNDGFHELETLMYPIPLCDKLEISMHDNQDEKIKFSTSGIVIDGSLENNLVFQAYNLINNDYQLPSLTLHLEKNIPFGAGLGGGSADCAFAIKGINEICKLNLSMKQMEDYAAKLGSDCPFFIKNQPAIATGRGELLEPFALNLSHVHFAVIIPPIPISTKEAYALVNPKPTQYSLNKSLQANIKNWKKNIVNNFEDSVFPQYPEIATIKNKLYDLGAAYAALSGSGSAVFGIFNNKPELLKAFSQDYYIWTS